MKHIERYETKETIEANMKDAGFGNVIRAYHRAKNYDADTLVFDEIIWEHDAKATADELKAQGLDEFIFTCKASNMFDTLALFEEAGYKVKGMAKVKTNRPDFSAGTGGETQMITDNGLLLARV